MAIAKKAGIADDKIILDPGVGFAKSYEQNLIITNKGVCSVQIDFEVEDGVVRKVHFTRGCNGNTQGISALVEGMNIDDVISRLKGTNCNGRGTSCPDQLAIALEQSKNM